MRKVYIIDDSLSVRKAIERGLSSEDCTVVGGASGKQAFGELEREAPDLVICDIVLPDVQGYEICEFIRRSPKLTGTPVVMISGIVDEDVEKRAAQAGAASVLRKPFTSEELRGVVEERLAEAMRVRCALDEAELLRQALGDIGAKIRCAVLLDPGSEDRVIIGAANRSDSPSELAKVASQALRTIRDLGMGSLQSVALESDEGAVVLCSVGGKRQLAVAFDRSVLLGKARYLARRSAEAVREVLDGPRSAARRAAS